MPSRCLPTAPRLHQSSAFIFLSLPSSPDRGRECLGYELPPSTADYRAAQSLLNHAEPLQALIHRHREECRVVSADPHEPVPFVRSQFIAFSHRRSPFINGEFDSLRNGKRRMVGSTDKALGVVSKLAAFEGTGGGSLAQDISEIEFLQ